ncbi:MAG: hypothetical protein HFF85_08835 [Oscillibacter sp.]|nr:hypothetical protein [Oscillibacter sp.]MCI9376492.1 hypothetical protein [Oscillibacter sp.]
MDKFPLLLDGIPSGELTAEREALYTWFTARCTLPDDGLWCAWLVGSRGELRLGILEPEGKRGRIRRRFSDRMTQPLGRLLRGEVRPAGAKETEVWEPAQVPDRLFHAPWLRQRLKGAQGVLTRTAGGFRYLALPYERSKPFPLTTLFCFAHIRPIGEKTYVVYGFDGDENPVF